MDVCNVALQPLTGRAEALAESGGLTAVAVRREPHSCHHVIEQGRVKAWEAPAPTGVKHKCAAIMSQHSCCVLLFCDVCAVNIASFYLLAYGVSPTAVKTSLSRGHWVKT